MFLEVSRQHDESKKYFENEMRKQKELSQNSIRRAVIEVEGKLQKKIDTLQSHLAGINCAAEGNSLGWREVNTNRKFLTNNSLQNVFVLQFKTRNPSLFLASVFTPCPNPYLPLKPYPTT